MTKQKIIGNQEEKKVIDDLLKQAGQDTVIDGVVKGKDVSEPAKEKSHMLNFGPFNFKACEKTRYIIMNVFNHIGYNDDGLFRYATNYDPSFTDSNAILAIDCLVFGLSFDKVKVGKKLVQRIEDCIGFTEIDNESMLVKHASNAGVVNLNTHHNAALALAYFALGEKKNIPRLITGIERFIRFDSGLVKLGVDIPELRSYPNALLSCVYLANGQERKASELVSNIEKRIKFDKPTGLIREKIGLPKPSIAGNAALALAYFGLGRGEEGSKLIKNIEEHIGFDKDNGLFRYEPGNSKAFLSVASALMALVYSAKEYYETEKK